jgi:glucose-6-phosphate isomerase
LEPDGSLSWTANPRYKKSVLEVKEPNDYSCLGIEKGLAIYPQFEKDPSRFLFVSDPGRVASLWADFIP